MADRKRGMGRGLAAILPESSAGGPELRELEVTQIEPNPDQPRTKFDPAALDALAGSIGSVGLLQPLIVRPIDDGRYELVAGERRWRAAQKAGIDRVPAVIRTSPEDERLQAALIENMVREDLNPGRGGPSLRLPGRRPRDLEGGARPPRRPQPRGDLQLDPPA